LLRGHRQSLLNMLGAVWYVVLIVEEVTHQLGKRLSLPRKAVCSLVDCYVLPVVFLAPRWLLPLPPLHCLRMESLKEMAEV